MKLRFFFPCFLVSLRLCLEDLLVFLPKSLNFQVLFVFSEVLPIRWYETLSHLVTLWYVDDQTAYLLQLQENNHWIVKVSDPNSHFTDAEIFLRTSVPSLKSIERSKYVAQISLWTPGQKSSSL